MRVSGETPEIKKATPRVPAPGASTVDAHRMEEVVVDDSAIESRQETSVEQALEDFVQEANSSFAEDYDGWDIASNIDKFVEQARTRPIATEEKPAVTLA